MSKKRLSTEHRAAIAATMSGRKASPETRERMVTAHRSRSPEAEAKRRDRVSRALTGRALPEAQRDKLRAAYLNRSPKAERERRRKIGAAVRKHPATPSRIPPEHQTAMAIAKAAIKRKPKKKNSPRYAEGARRAAARRMAQLDALLDEALLLDDPYECTCTAAANLPGVTLAKKRKWLVAQAHRRGLGVWVETEVADSTDPDDVDMIFVVVVDVPGASIDWRKIEYWTRPEKFVPAIASSTI